MVGRHQTAKNTAPTNVKTHHIAGDSKYMRTLQSVSIERDTISSFVSSFSGCVATSANHATDAFEQYYQQGKNSNANPATWANHQFARSDGCSTRQPKLNTSHHSQNRHFHIAPMAAPFIKDFQ